MFVKFFTYARKYVCEIGLMNMDSAIKSPLI